LATFNKFNSGSLHVVNGVLDWDNHTFKNYLTNATPVATNTAFGTPAEITAANGYTAGGPTVGMTTALVGGTTPARVTAADPTPTTATGAVGPFQYVVLFDDTVTSPYADPLFSWWNYGSSISLANTETFTYDYDGTNGLFDFG
jgi:hypothetical protein